GRDRPDLPAQQGPADENPTAVPRGSQLHPRAGPQAYHVQRYRARRRHGQRKRRMAVGMLPRNPYTVGGPVRGSHFYGRTALIQSILDGNDRAIWVVGNRRIGKTSLLRRMEQLGASDGR